MRLKKLVLVLAALLMVATLAACGGGETSGADQGRTQQTTPDQQVAPDSGSEGSGDEQEQVQAPEDKTLRLTVPKMERIENSEIPTGQGTAKRLFKENAAVHLTGTGYPWEEEANVYIAGHRLGYPGTDSYLAFNDIEVLQNGDEVILEDAEGRTYTYEVFNTLVVEPTNLSVLEPIEGKNIVSLQSCTLPDYSDRIIVQAELKDTQA
ncbi:MAG TPA: class E sortase [Rubrobacteraceae bacterium]|nr:class E sortase [Rubrobacteraceae bacterium]